MKALALNFFALTLLLSTARAQVAPKYFGSTFEGWAESGQTNLFSLRDGAVQVSWDSSTENSYFYLPLGLSLTRADDFALSLVFRLDALDLGTTPGKPDTFEIAAGLVNLTNALAPEFFRGAGINAQHGPRNLVELDYFPASGFITATLAPTIATANNQILFSNNHPLELQFGAWYKVTMSFTATDQTVRSELWESASSNDFPNDPIELKPLMLSDSYSDFSVDTLALINYNDAGQTPPQFSGSLKGAGLFTKTELVVYNRTSLRIEPSNGGWSVSFETSIGWRYQLETKGADQVWETFGAPIVGADKMAMVKITGSSPIQLFRVVAQRL